MKKLLIIFLWCFQTSNPKFSFKDVNLWITGNKEETFFEEYIINPHSTIVIENYNGPITIKSWSADKIAITALLKRSEKISEPFTMPVTLDSTRLTIHPISSELCNTISYKLMVPTHAHLIIKTLNGPIKIKNSEGPIQATTQKGIITMQGIKNNVLALASGNINISFDKIMKDKEYVFKSSRGNVTLTCPSDSNIQLKASTTYGTIISDHFITLNPITLTLNKQTWDSFKRHIQGVIGKPEALFEIHAYNGISLLQP